MPAPTVFVPVLSARELRQITQAVRSSDNPKMRDRCRAVLWSAEGKTTGEIAKLLSVNMTTPMRWIKDYLRFGFDGLVPETSTGRPRTVDADAEEVLRQALEKNPRDLGYRFTRWTVATLAEHLRSILHIQVSPASVGRALKRIGYCYKRPKLSLKHRQDQAQVHRAKRQRKSALKKLQPNQSATPFSSRTNANSISTPV